jgi:hypothetical protein
MTTEYEFGQLCAEAVHRLGQPLVESYLTSVAKNIGGPIPQRTTAGLGLDWHAWCLQQNEAARPTGAHKRCCNSQRR